MGKKKKGGNKLAKMSDEERARYMQHRAQMEEEAKRRKEELIATFLKNKMKREEAFTRLNTAKINEYWHQILRKVCNDSMKAEIESLSKWVEKVVEIRNKLINKLQVELDESEQQYEMNLQSHLTFIDQFIDTHHKRQEYFRQDFEVKSNVMIREAAKEREKLVEKNSFELDYLKTVIHGMEVTYESEIKSYKKRKTDIIENYSSAILADHEAMVSQYVKSMDAIWRQIYELLNDYLSTTAERRHHYIELKHLDERNMLEREENERKIQHYRKLINTTKANNESFHENSQNQIKYLTKERDTLHKNYESLKKNLTLDLKKFEKRLTFMTVCSNNAITELTKTIKKGENIIQIVTCCRRLETEDEKIMNWTEMRKKWYELHGLSNVLDSPGARKGDRVISSARKITEKDLDPESQISLLEKEDTMQKNQTDGSKKKDQTPKEHQVNQPSPALSLKEINSKIDEKDPKHDETVKEDDLNSDIIDEQVIEIPDSKEITQDDESFDNSCYQTEQDISILEKSTKQIFQNIHHLQSLSSLCWVQNRVEMEIIELKEEKCTLKAENKRLQEIIKGILEDAVLEPPKPKKPSLKLRKNISSAPASISSAKWGKQLPTCVVLSFD